MAFCLEVWRDFFLKIQMFLGFIPMLHREIAFSLNECTPMDTSKKYKLPVPRFTKSPFLLVAGWGGRFTQDTAQDIPSLWAKFLADIEHIPNREGDETYGVCCNPDGKGGFEYIAGVRVSTRDDLPEHYRWVELQEQNYAVFEHRGSLDNLGQMFQAIWNDWLPSSDYEAVDAPEFERYSPDYDVQTLTGVLEIWLPVKPRASPARG